MKRLGISPEYIYKPISGSFNMNEKRSFMGSKMMDIEDTIILDQRDIVYYQQPSGEQFDINQELILDPIIYSISQDKNDNHLFGVDNSQSDVDRNNKTKWVLEVNMRKILRNYIYSNIKSSRTFNGISSSDTSTKSVNESIYRYIDDNIIDRYEYSKIDFYVEYVNLSENNINRYTTNYDPSIEIEDNSFRNIRTLFSEDSSMVRIFLTQEKSSKEFTFNYYFNIYFNKK